MVQVDKQLVVMEKLPEHVDGQFSILGMSGANLSVQVEYIRDQFTPYYQLWKSVHWFQTASAQWLHGPFNTIDAEAVERSVGQCLAITKYE